MSQKLFGKALTGTNRQSRKKRKKKRKNKCVCLCVFQGQLHCQSIISILLMELPAITKSHEHHAASKVNWLMSNSEVFCITMAVKILAKRGWRDDKAVSRDAIITQGGLLLFFVVFIASLKVSCENSQYLRSHLIIKGSSQVRCPTNNNTVTVSDKAGENGLSLHTAELINMSK